MLYTSSIKIPDTATAISFQFKQYNIDQNNNKAGFVLPLYDEEGNPLSGSASQIANFYGLGERYGGVEIPEDSIIANYESDFEKDPSLEQQWALPYVVAIKSDKKKASAFVEKQMQAAKENDSLSEDDYSKLSQVNAAVGNKEAADSLRGLIPEKFPKGNLASLNYYQKFYQ